MSDLPVVKSRLPSNLNPAKFKNALNVYADDYENRYSLDYGRWGFLIDNDVPFTLWVAEGINGKELYDRPLVVRLLRIAQKIYRETGKWPEFLTEWEEMCPGGLAKLNVTTLTDASRSAFSLLDTIKMIAGRLDKILESPDAAFTEAELRYREELKGLSSFNDVVRRVQREFDEHPLCVLNTNTKTRRLRFITALARFAETGMDSQRLANLLLTWASQHIDSLQAYTDPKGAILASSGLRSALPYLELAKELGILTPVGRGVTVTNEGRALVLLVPPQEVFSLRLQEQLYFFYELLIRDRDMFYPLLSLLKHGKHRKRDVRAEFPEAYKQYLIRLRGHCGTARSRRQLDDALERISRWRRPEVYMEHVVEPRLSWFVDLDFCHFENDQVLLTETGARVAEVLREPCEEGVIPVTKEFLRRRFFKVFAPLLVPPEETLKKPSRAELVNFLTDCCNILLRSTKSLAPNRIVASTLLRYAGVKLFVEHRIAADFRDLTAFLMREESANEFPWRLRWQQAQDDGYLTRVTTAQS